MEAVSYYRLITAVNRGGSNLSPCLAADRAAAYYLCSIPLVHFDLLVEEILGISLKRHSILVDHSLSYLQLYNIKSRRLNLNLHFTL